MKEEIRRPDYIVNVYRYRGAFTIMDRVKTPNEFMHETIIDELSKQISLKISDIIGLDVKTLKRKDTEIEIPQYLGSNIVNIYKQSIYIKLRLSIYMSVFLWIKCTCLSPEITYIDPHSDVSGLKLKFEIVYHLPQEFKVQAFGYLLEWAKNETDPKKKSELENTYQNLIKQDAFDGWITEVKKCLGVTEDAHQKDNFRFEYEIACGWPDVIFQIHFNERVTAKTVYNVEALINKFIINWNNSLDDNNDDNIIDYVGSAESEENKKSVNIHVDFGRSDPEKVLMPMLKHFSDSQLDIKKIVLT